MEPNPALSPEQRKAALRGNYPKVPAVCVVTGGTGFVGQRLCEMLIERGAKTVRSFDIVPPHRMRGKWTHPSLEYHIGDITDIEAVERVVRGADCVWHLAAAVGPYHPNHLYEKVNVEGTDIIIAACKKYGVPKMVMASSPATRFKGSKLHRPNYDGLTEDEMPKLPLPRGYLQAYAETKARAEMAVTAAVTDTFLAVNVAPHMVYGPRDNLFMPNFLEVAGTGNLRIFASGNNRIGLTHVDNYCHALVLAERKLYKGSNVLGKFYIATDGKTHPEEGEYCIFWKEANKAVVGMGFADLKSKMAYPFWFLYLIALIGDLLGWLLGTTFKLNMFNVFALTMNRWFKTTAISTDFEYDPIVPFEAGWTDTIEWFRENWLPEFEATRGMQASVSGLWSRSQAKIDIQAKSVLNSKKLR